MRPHLLIASFALTFSPALAVASPPPMTDVVLARSALAAIDADAGVRGVNLIVSVVDRVAVIGGPVPSAEVGKRAEEVVRSINGITEVRNNCFVQEKPDPLLKAVADRLAAGPRPLVAELPAVVPQSAPHATPVPHSGYGLRGAEVRPAPTTEAPARPADAGFAALAAPPPVLPVAAPVAAADKVVVASRPPILNTDPTDGFLGTPGSGRSAAVLTGGSVPLAPPKAAFPARPNDVLTSADAIRKADARYGALTAEMRDGTLVVGGKAERLSDAWDFAQSLRRVPGVARVVVGGVGVK